MIEGFVCDSDPTDTFMLPIAGPAFVSLELRADPKPGNVDVRLLDAGNVIVARSKGTTGVEVIHARIPAAADYRVQVTLESGPAGAPFVLHYRTLPE
ncbi:hypothetical protein DB30_03266 [Enhygromyxa salina]|uniref:Uncharacterized protein n=1 Tax=Enhygromyxa salina TaxID=215803 RepID=A0A0C1Z2E4_9BACT|nr:hypothetical protein DB30_03266 [Enhygromyxa salina]